MSAAGVCKHDNTLSVIMLKMCCSTASKCQKESVATDLNVDRTFLICNKTKQKHSLVKQLS